MYNIERNKKGVIRMLRNIKLTREEVLRLRNRRFDFGGESVIAKSDSPDMIFKLYRESVTPEERENKHKKLELVTDRKIKFIAQPQAVLTSEGQIVGHAFDYDIDDMPMLIASLSVKDKLFYFRQIKMILNYFRRNGIIFADLKCDNILINPKTGRLRFCDIDSIQIDDLKTSIHEDYLSQFFKDGMVDERIHVYLHNLMLLDELLVDQSSDAEDALETIDLERVRKAFNLDCQKIIETIVKRKSNYHDLFLIDGIKEENIVKYKKR